MSHRGFSLIELIVAIAIAAILVGIAVPVMGHYLDRARLAADTAYMTEVLRLATLEGMKDGKTVTEITLTREGSLIVTTEQGEDEALSALVLSLMPEATFDGFAAETDENGSLPCAMTLTASGALIPRYPSSDPAEDETTKEEDGDLSLIRAIYRQAVLLVRPDKALPVELHLTTDAKHVVKAILVQEDDTFPVDLEELRTEGKLSLTISSDKYISSYIILPSEDGEPTVSPL